MRPVMKVGVGGPVGSGKTALVEKLVPMLVDAGRCPAVIANDIFTREDERILKRALEGRFDTNRIVGVETGGCPHTAVREDPTANLMAVEALMDAYPETDIVLIESGGDNLTLTFSPLLADRSIYVLDVAGGDKTPRKQGPGLMNADLLVINKTDLAPYVGADLEVMRADSERLRSGPLVFTDCRHGDGLESVLMWLLAELEASATAVGASGVRLWVD
jgi:urease accessory protein